MTEPRKLQAHTIGRAICVEPPNEPRYLVAEIQIECDICGQHLVRFAGHHLRAIRNFLTETIEEFPDLTLKDGDVHALDRWTLQGPGNDPEQS